MVVQPLKTQQMTTDTLLIKEIEKPENPELKTENRIL
jgi:hypothetical protein